MPFFTIIASYYQVTTDKEIFKRFVDSLRQQSFMDFEVLIYHDGPMYYQIESPYQIFCTPERFNLWGHPQRFIGLKQAKGKYILHTNIDNAYNLHALQNLYDTINKTHTDIMIAKVEMMGLNHGNGKIWYDQPRDYSKSVTLSGNPPVYGNIDLMQAVIAKKIWDQYGWFCFKEQADGIIYQKICSENKYICTDTIIGKHY
ncbi:MAG TPA: glycosyltransferase family A protein [Chitinispirillaceae bacterium]|jgi:hypothetical protein|nr:glycosyltransferase family A protein [Chitinispirillaceae bacterium]